MATTTNYGWETPDDTDLVKDGAAAIRTLGNSIDTTTKNLNPETTTGDIAYRSATANTNTRLPIGTNGQILAVSAGVPAWINNDQGDITEVQAGTGISVASGTGPIPVVTNTVATAIDAKGDLIVGTGADTFSRLAVGTNDYILTAASGETTGLKWAAPSSPTWTSYTPTYTNVSVGNGTVVAEYAVSGDIVFIRYLLTCGSTTSITGTIRIGFPSGYNASTTLNGIHFSGGINGWVRANDNSVNNTVYAQPQVNSATEFAINIMGSAGTYVDAQASLNATVPFTWATSDQLQAVFYYRKA